MARVLLVEPYYTGSHRAWADGYAGASTHTVQLLTLPGRFWKWRMFGGTLTLARRARDIETPDVVLATDMVDLAGFLGHAGYPAHVPKTILYMHENQLTYPPSPTAGEDLAYAYLNWSSMVRADQVWFNSAFHLESVERALPAFLKHFPDHRHVSLVDEVMEKSTVLPVGVDLSRVSAGSQGAPPLVLWNQRWEYDKNPGPMIDALCRLAENGHDFRVALCGENFRNVPVEFEEAKERLSGRIVQYGFAERSKYEQLLAEADVVVSTAEHEFFGVGAVEAMAAGAAPVFPNRLSYPELVPGELHAETLYDDERGLDGLLAAALTDVDRRQQLGNAVSQAMQRFSWERMAPRYDRALAR